MCLAGEAFSPPGRWDFEIAWDPSLKRVLRKYVFFFDCLQSGLWSAKDAGSLSRYALSQWGCWVWIDWAGIVFRLQANAKSHRCCSLPYDLQQRGFMWSFGGGRYRRGFDSICSVWNMQCLYDELSMWIVRNLSDTRAVAFLPDRNNVMLMKELLVLLLEVVDIGLSSD